MKKSVIILIGIIYIASIVFISFFGMKMVLYNETVYVEKVECINDDIKENSSGEKYIILNYEEGLVYQIRWRVYPDNASNKEVEFVYDKQNKMAEINAFGAVIFKPMTRTNTLSVQIRSTDGTNRAIKLKIIVLVN